MAKLSLHGITKKFGETVAVKDLNLEVKEGEFITLLGPSGCGKTTTLRMIAGFLSPDRGQIFIDGKDVSRIPPQKRNIGMVFQDYALFPHLTIKENVEFSLKERRVPKNKRNRLCQEFLDLVQLPFPNRYPAALSGGQQQRVALARALVFDPSILLLDEPLGALDVKLRELMQLEIKRIQLQLKITAIYVTHDQSEALTMSDRILVMDGGVTMQCGSPEEIYEKPLNDFVADFVGDTNFLECKVFDKFWVQGAGGERIKVGEGIEFPKGTPVRIAIRPENIHLDRPNFIEDNRLNQLKGVVTDRKYLGSRTKYYVRVGEWTLIAEKKSDMANQSPGENVVIHWDPIDTFVWRH
jgi:spermidine/putrescine ABC transporter ATP-binding subunit